MARTLGISGCALYVPCQRVDLQSWCDWYGASWPKIKEVVGRSFRMPSPRENVYTMAATAVLRLIQRYDVDPRRVGFLGFGTESSTDNAIGAVIIKGLVNEVLASRGQPLLPRACEVPEFKQACLGGVYALKGAIRYLALDGADQLAIVVSADVASYLRGSSGEPTQGAGAVAQLMAEDPTLVSIDPSAWAGTSAYRVVDFRKPTRRYSHPAFLSNGRLQDRPIFNGHYSALCFLDEVKSVVEELGKRRGVTTGALLRSAAAIFMHRPYAKLPVDALAALCAIDWAQAPTHRAELAAACQSADVELAQVIEEASQTPDLPGSFRTGYDNGQPYSSIAKLAKRLRQDGEFPNTVAPKLAFGADTMADLGNLYTASLPAWLAAGLEDAAERGVDLAGREVLLVGYGSGNAAEALTVRVAERWQEEALKLRIAADLGDGVRLSRAQYEALHDGAPVTCPSSGGTELEIERVGEAFDEKFSDLGVDYYRLART